VAGVFDHDVVVVAIADSEHVRRHAVASAACREVVHRLQGMHTTQIRMRMARLVAALPPLPVR